MDVLTPVATGPTRLVTGPIALRRWAVASLVANIVIVVTGALVRLTDSGMGCPTWPRCTDASYVPHAALGVHGVIEFANRLLTFVLVLVAVLTLVCAWRTRVPPSSRRVRVVALVMAIGIPAQGVIGGITVLTHLNPFVVALHLLASFALIGFGVWLVRTTFDLRPRLAGRRGLLLTRVTFALMVLAVWLGTVVTGSGPHSGDRGAVRTGFDAELVSHVHAWAVYAVVAATVACVVLLRSRAAIALLVLELCQGVVGFVQYFNGLPIPVVALHLLGAAGAIALATNLLLSVRRDHSPG